MDFSRMPLTREPRPGFRRDEQSPRSGAERAAPYGSFVARSRPDPGGTWRMPPLLFATEWILMALGYTYSGAAKLVSPSWLDGTAIAQIMENPLARPGARKMPSSPFRTAS